MARRRYTPKLKAQLVLEVLAGDRTLGPVVAGRDAGAAGLVAEGKGDIARPRPSGATDEDGGGLQAHSVLPRRRPQPPCPRASGPLPGRERPHAPPRRPACSALAATSTWWSRPPRMNGRPFRKRLACAIIRDAEQKPKQDRNLRHVTRAIGAVRTRSIPSTGVEGWQGGLPRLQRLSSSRSTRRRRHGPRADGTSGERIVDPQLRPEASRGR